MKKKMSKKMLRLLIFNLVLSVFISAAWAADSDSGYALLIQQSPPDAGSVSPGSGVHKMEIGQTVSISAVPKAGYRFLYWLGDVSSTGTSDTTIQIDSPKMVVAVFARDAYEEELSGVRSIQGSTASDGGGGGGGRFYSPLQSPASVSPGDYYNPGNIIYNFSDQSTGNDDIPAPGGDDDIPVPGEDGTDVPEPTTILLLGLGAAAFLRKNQ